MTRIRPNLTTGALSATYGTLADLPDPATVTGKAAALALGEAGLPGAFITDRGAAPLLGTNTHASGNTSRVKYNVRRAGGDLRLVFDHYTTGSGGDGDPSAAVTFRCSLEKNGFNFPVTFRGGQKEVTIDQGRIISDPIAFDVAVGDTIWARTYVSAGTPRATARTVTGDGEGLAATDLTAAAAGAVTASASWVWAPSGFLSTTRLGSKNAAIGICGDSIAYGQGDSTGDVYGYLVRSANTAGLPWVMAARASETVGAVVDINYRHRGPLVSGCQRVYTAYGRNDLTNGNATSLIQINLVKFWKRIARRGPIQYAMTVTPRTTSTDAWATTANQTTADAAQETRRVELNTWLRAGAPLDPTTLLAVAAGTAGAVVAGQAAHPLAGIVEVADAVETARNSGIWKAAYTADGLHPNATGHAAMSAAVVM